LTFVLLAYDASGNNPKAHLLAEGVDLVPGKETTGTGTTEVFTLAFRRKAAVGGVFFASGGVLGTQLETLLAHRASDLVYPKYDAFGLPTDYFPPTDPDLFGGTPGSTAAEQYLSNAKAAAQAATDAVKTAFDKLLTEAKDEATVSGALDKADFVSKQMQQSLCGNASDAACDTSLSDYTLEFTNEPSCDFGGQTAAWCPGITQFVERLLAPYQLPMRIASAVKASVGSTATPQFSEFDGGQLQTLFIQQWTAIRDLSKAIDAVVDAQRAAILHVNTAQVVLATASEEVRLNCGERLSQAIKAGTSGSVGIGTGGVSFSASYSPGPYIAALQRCKDSKLVVSNDVAAAREASAQAYSGLSDRAVQLVSAQGQVALVSAQIQQALFQVQQASDREQFEAKLTSLSTSLESEFYHRYTSYDLWRAKALLEDARRQAVLARRAIEARYVVDLSKMSDPEPFVASPSTWADEVYSYDLSLPASVGLTVGTPSDAGIYPNKLLDYITNLERFVEGYSVKRASSAVKEDTDVVSIYGPSGLVPGTLSSGPGSSGWSVLCGDATWHDVDGSIPVETCCSDFGGSPTKARLLFPLDPWGRLAGWVADEPFSQRYNTRWTRLSVNLVGTGIKDCTKAVDAQTCYSEGFVRYNLSQSGDPWVTDFEGSWHLDSLAEGQIEGAKALAAEMWVDSLVHNFSDNIVGAVARSEFNERPVGGSYQLEIEMGPEFRLDHLDRVQLLVGTSYWVAQQ
jgi:hypothetical protein